MNLSSPTVKQRGKLIIPAALWTVSAAYVGGYTWSAVTGNKADFPFPAFGGGPAQTTSQAAQAAGATKGGVVSTLQNIGNTLVLAPLSHLPIVGGIFGGLESNPGNLSTAEIKRLNSLPNIPAPLIRALKMNATNSQGYARAYAQAEHYAKTHGWRQSDFKVYLGYLGNLYQPSPTGFGGKSGPVRPNSPLPQTGQRVTNIPSSIPYGGGSVGPTGPVRR